MGSSDAPDASSAASPLRFIDLFSGAGGLTEGFRRAGFDPAFALDRDADSCATYALNHPGIDIEPASITDLKPRDIAKRAGHVDVVVGGPSCQGFSTHGRANGWVREDDDRNRLWEHMLEVVAYLRPRAFLMENVPGLVYWQQGSFGRKILDGFEALGYSVDFQILLAADHGVPQRRRRLFIVGLLGNQPFRFPDKTHLGGWRRDTLPQWEEERRRLGLLKHLRTWEAIGDLPPLTVGKTASRYRRVQPSPLIEWLRHDSEQVRDHELTDVWETYKPLIPLVPQGGTWRDLPPHLLPERFRGMRRTDSTNLLGRLDPHLPAYTITTQFTNVTTGCFIHPYEDRPLSVREGARLQTFPDSYRFVGSTTSRCRQIGNAVPPLLAYVLASALGHAILGEGAGSPAPIPPAEKLPGALRVKSGSRMRTGKPAGARGDPVSTLRRALHAAGVRFLRDHNPLELKRPIDVAVRGVKVAVLFQECFWRGCPKHARDTASKLTWWGPAIERNRECDAETSKALRSAGWRVVVVWEHEDPGKAAGRVLSAIDRRRRLSA